MLHDHPTVAEESPTRAAGDFRQKAKLIVTPYVQRARVSALLTAYTSAALIVVPSSLEEHLALLINSARQEKLCAEAVKGIGARRAAAGRCPWVVTFPVVDVRTAHWTTVELLHISDGSTPRRQIDILTCRKLIVVHCIKAKKRELSALLNENDNEQMVFIDKQNNGNAKQKNQNPLTT